MMKIFIVDDDARIRKSLAELLDDEGYHVESCSNGEDALNRSDLYNWDLFNASSP